MSNGSFAESSWFVPPPRTESSSSGGSGGVGLLWRADGNPWRPRLGEFDLADTARQLGAVLVSARADRPAPEGGIQSAQDTAPARLGRLVLPQQMFDRGILSNS